MDEHKDKNKERSWKITSLAKGAKFAKLIAAQFPKSQQNQIELILNELILNAIEHGFLKISSSKKEQLLKEGPDVWLNAIHEGLKKKIIIKLIVMNQ